MSEERPYPQKGDTLFKGGLDIDLNADISYWNKDLSGYEKGYKDAADFIVNGAMQNGRAYNFNVSFLVFPVVFLYRQYIELRLKEVILLGTRLNGETHRFPTHHRIDELWRHARPYPERLATKEALDALELCIKEFCALDPDGTAFRYPVDRDRKSHLPEWTVINLRHLGETMERIGHLLDDSTQVMYIEFQQMAEFQDYH